MAMDLISAGVSLQRVKTSCSKYLTAAQTKVMAFCRRAEKSNVYQRLMDECRDIHEEVKALWVSLCSRKTSERPATSTIKSKYQPEAQEVESKVRLSREEKVEARRVKRETEKAILFNTNVPVHEHESMADLLRATNRTARELQKQLHLDLDLEQVAGNREESLMVRKKQALVNNIFNCQQMRSNKLGKDFTALANELYYCQTAIALSLRLDKGDVPAVVRRELKAELNKVK